MKLKNIPALSGVLLGVFLAAADYHVNIPSAICLVLAAVFIQLLSDHCSQEQQQGRDMKTPYLLLFMACGLAGIYLSYGSLLLMEPLVLMVMGYFSIRYATHGKITSSPGTGDIYRLLLYGPAALYGTYFVCSHSFGSLMLLLPACASGLFAIGILGHGRNNESAGTTASYRVVVLASGLILITAYSFLRILDPMHFLYVLTLPLFVWTSVLLLRKSPLATLVMSVSVLLLTLLTGLGYVSFLF